MRAWTVCLTLTLGGVAPAQTSFAELRTPDPAYTPDQLIRMSEAQLVELYLGARPGPLPDGYTPGRVIYKPGSVVTAPASHLLRWTVWQGKYFHDGRMTNRTFGLPSVTTPSEVGTSYLDGRPSLVFDYAGSRPFFVRMYRDEIREVASGVYLGIMHRRDHHGATVATWFALDARAACGCAEATQTQAATGRSLARTGP